MNDQSRQISRGQAAVAHVCMDKYRMQLESMTIQEICDFVYNACGVPIKPLWAKEHTEAMGIDYVTAEQQQRLDAELASIADIPNLQGKCQSLLESMAVVTEATVDIKGRLEKLEEHLGVSSAGDKESGNQLSRVTPPPQKQPVELFGNEIDVKGLQSVTTAIVEQLSDGERRLGDAIETVTVSVRKLAERLTRLLGAGMLPGGSEHKLLNAWYSECTGHLTQAEAEIKAVHSQHKVLMRQIKSKGLSPNMFEFDPEVTGKKGKFQQGQLILPMVDTPEYPVSGE